MIGLLGCEDSVSPHTLGWLFASGGGAFLLWGGAWRAGNGLIILILFLCARCRLAFSTLPVHYFYHSSQEDLEISINLKNSAFYAASFFVVSC